MDYRRTEHVLLRQEAEACLCARREDDMWAEWLQCHTSGIQEHDAENDVYLFWACGRMGSAHHILHCPDHGHALTVQEGAPGAERRWKLQRAIDEGVLALRQEDVRLLFARRKCAHHRSCSERRHMIVKTCLPRCPRSPRFSVSSEASREDLVRCSGRAPAGLLVRRSPPTPVTLGTLAHMVVGVIVLYQA